MKVYGMEMVLNDNGNVRLLYDSVEGQYYSIWEHCRYGGIDRVDSINPKTLRNKLYKNKVILRRVG